MDTKYPDSETAEKLGIMKEELRDNVRIDMEKIREGDNEAWKTLLKYTRWRLEIYVRKVIDRYEDAMDIVSDAIAYVYASRKMFATTSEISRQLTGFVKNRRAAYFLMKRNANRFILSDDMIVKIDWYLQQQESFWEEKSPEEREKLDEWKDQMLEIIKYNAKKLPADWRITVETFLTMDTMRDVYTKLKERYHKMNDTHLRVEASFRGLKRLIQIGKDPANREEMLKKFREVLMKLSAKQKEVIRMIAIHKTKEAVLETGKFTIAEYAGALQVARTHIKKIGIDARITDEIRRNRKLNSIEFFAGEKDPDIQKIFDEVIMKEDPIRDAMVQASRSVFTYEQFKLAIEYRIQGLSHNEINQKLGLKKIVWARYFNRLPDKIKSKFPHLKNENIMHRITPAKMAEVRRRHKAGATIRSLAAELGVDPATVKARILNAS